MINFIFKLINRSYEAEVQNPESNEGIKNKFIENILIFLDLIIQLLKLDNDSFLLGEIQILLIEVI